MGEHSTERVLFPFFNHLEQTNTKLLSSGYQIKIAYFAGDTLISQSVCGLKEGVGNAHYPCRQCYVQKTEILQTLNENMCRLRTLSETRSLSIDQKGLQKIPNFWKFDFFDAIQQIPQDIMHVLLEGVCRRQVINLIDDWILTKRTNLAELNRCIKNFDYGYKHKKNKIPGLLDADLKKKSLVVSASQMKSLVLLFPFIFDRIIDITHEEYK